MPDHDETSPVERDKETFRPGLLRGRRAIVSGGTSGIGAGVAQILASLGAEVHAAGLAPAEAGFGDGIAVHQLDVTNARAVERFLGSFAAIDILVNCAGIIRRGEEHDPAVFEQVLAVNLLGTMRLCAAARPRLAGRNGCIVNIASMLSFFGGGLVPAYAASKGGVAQLTKSLAIAYAPDGIRVNAVAPGWIATPLTAALQSDPARSRAILDRTPLGRWGDTHEVAGAVAFLCSPAACFITGIILPVDGGYLIA